MMKLLFIVHEGALYGSQQSLCLLIEGLRALNNPPHICVSLAKGGPLQARLTAMGVTVTTHKRLAWFKHTRRNRWQHVEDVFSLLQAIPGRVRCLAAAVKQTDVVHTNSLVSLEGALAAWWYRKPHIWHIREWLTPDNPGLFPVLPVGMTQWLVSKLSARVVCISTAVMAGIKPGKRKAVILPNAVIKPNNALPARPKTFVVGFVGRFSVGKRVTDIIEAFAPFHAKHPDTALWLMGQAENPTDKARVENTLGKYPDGVTQQGFCTQMDGLYPQLAVLALPASNEAFGRVLAEAMALGVPCIGANAGGIPDVIGETGWLYPPGNISALTGQLFLAYDEWQASLGGQMSHWPQRQQACIQRVNAQFSLSAQIDHIMAIYQAVLPT